MSVLRGSRRWIALPAVLIVTVVAATTALGATRAKPGPTTRPVTLTTGVTLSGYDIGTNATGTAYIAWIADTVSTDPSSSSVHLCTVKPGTTSCAGPVQVVSALGDNENGLRVLVEKSGLVELVWFYGTETGGQIGIASTNAAGTLQPATEFGPAPDDGLLLDAELAPDGSVWTVAGTGYTSGLQVITGAGNPVTTVATSYSVGDAELAFAKGTPVIATQQAASITKPAGYTFESHGSWSPIHNVANTWTAGARVGLVATGSGLRLVASEDNADYLPVVSKWTGAGFSKPVLAGEITNCEPRSHDVVVDASGRMADVSYECEKIAVTNFPNTTRAAVVRFPAGGTIDSSPPRVATTPRGFALAVWSIEAGNFDRLLVVPVLLPDLTTTATKKSSAGSCLPPDDIGVGVRGKPAAGWRVERQSLTLGGATLRSVLSGASLDAGRTYRLEGHVTFVDGRTTSSQTATLQSRSCPKA
jgi:hypothetical protein